MSAPLRRHVFTLRQPLGGTVVYLADPADIKPVFAGDPRVFHAGEAHRMLRGVLGDGSLFVIDGDGHRGRLRLMTQPFHRDAVAKQAGQMAEIAAANIAECPVSKSFRVATEMTEIAREVTLRTVIGATDPARATHRRHRPPRR